MSTKTITLAGSEERAEFSGANAWLRNDGADVIYAAAKPGITAGADGVVAILAGQSAPVYGANGSVYLLGNGSVQLIGSDYSTNPFKTSAQAGGSGADNVARAAITAHSGNADIHVTAAEKSAWDGKADTSDIPTKISELTNDSGFITSADGGNADMLDGLHAVDFSQIINYGNTPTDTKEAVGIDGKCTVYRCSSWTDYPAALTNGQGHIIAINYKGSGTAGSDSMWVRQIYISANTSITDPRLYQRYISASNVSDWIDIADGGNAATVGGKTITVTDVDPGAGSALGTGEIVFVTEVT